MIKLFEKSDWAKIDDPVEPMVDVEPDLSAFDNGIGVTVEQDGVVLGCGGIVLMSDDMGEVWIRISKKAKPIAVMTGLKAGLKILRNSYKDVALTCRVIEGFEKGHKLVKRLGFVTDRVEDNYQVYTWQQQH